MFAAAILAAVRLESGKFDPAPALAETAAPVNLGKSAIYGTTFGHPVETRSAALIIPPIASRSGRSLPPSWTQVRAGKLLAIFTNWRVKAQFGAVNHQTSVILSTRVVAGQSPVTTPPLKSAAVGPSFVLLPVSLRSLSGCSLLTPPTSTLSVFQLAGVPWRDFGKRFWRSFLERWNREC